MRISVCLAVYNASRYLQKAIDSVLEQTYPGFELLILDDGSTDPEVANIIWGVEDPRVSAVRFNPTVQERSATVRYATNFNYGVAHTTGEFVTFLCGDDFYLPDRFRRMVEALDEGHQVVYGSQILLQENGDRVDNVGLRQASIPLEDAFHRVDLNSVMMSRALFESVGGFPTDPEMWKDADAYLWRKITAAGHLFMPVPGQATDVKHYRPNSVTDNVIDGKPPWHHESSATSLAWERWVPAA